MNASNWMAFAGMAFLLVISPGPNTFLIFNKASFIGKKAAIANLLGIFSATFLHGTLTIFGLSIIVLKSQNLFFLIKFIGALYLAYIGIKLLIGSFKNDTSIFGNSKPEEKVKNQNFMSNYGEGFLTQMLNPKVSMFYIAALPNFLPAHNDYYYFNSYLLVLTHATIIFLWFISMIFFIKNFKDFLSRKSIGKFIQRVSGGFMLYFSYFLIRQKPI